MTEKGLAPIHAALEEWNGESLRCYEFRHAGISDRIPTLLDVLVFKPTEADLRRGTEPFLCLATAGLSLAQSTPDSKPVEVLLYVDGDLSETAEASLARELAELVTMPFRLRKYLGPNLVVCDIGLSIFASMECALFTDYGTFEPEWLPGLSPPVRLLDLRPIYAAEADIIEQIGDRAAIRQFYKAGVKLDDPNRPPFMLTP